MLILSFKWFFFEIELMWFQFLLLGRFFNSVNYTNYLSSFIELHKHPLLLLTFTSTLLIGEHSVIFFQIIKEN